MHALWHNPMLLADSLCYRPSQASSHAYLAHKLLLYNLHCSCLELMLVQHPNSALCLCVLSWKSEKSCRTASASPVARVLPHAPQ